MLFANPHIILLVVISYHKMNKKLEMEGVIAFREDTIF